MPRFHCPVELAIGRFLNLPDGAARHVQVLRMQPGGIITLFNGQGGEYDAIIDRMGRSDVQVQVTEHRSVEREAPREVHLAIGMPANERMDWLVEKATELGVASIQPLMTGRTVLRVKGDRADRKTAHWQGIAIAACEQCGRNRVPPVAGIESLERWLAQPVPTNVLRLMLAPGADATLAALPRPTADTRIELLIGAEGGLAPEELDRATQAGFVGVRLGPRILRTETAGIAALSAILYECGDLGGM